MHIEYKVSLIERRTQLFKPKTNNSSNSLKRSLDDCHNNTTNNNEDSYDNLEDSESTPNKKLLRSEALGGLAAGSWLY